MLSRTDRVSSTECDRYPYADHGVLGIRRQERARCAALFRADSGDDFLDIECTYFQGKERDAFDIRE
jgi:hypothetical protein